MVAREKAFATVTSLSPLRVRFDGSTDAVPADNYGLLVAVGQRVLMQLFPPPRKPLISAPLSAAPPPSGGDTVLNFSIDATKACAAVVSIDIADVVAANVGGDPYAATGWTLGYGDPTVFTVSDTGIVIDFDAYTGGSAGALNVIMVGVGLTTDKALQVIAATSSAVAIGMPVLPWDPSGFLALGQILGVQPVSETVQTPEGVAVPLNYQMAVTDTTATVTGSVEIEVAIYGLTPSGTYVDYI